VDASLGPRLFCACLLEAIATGCGARTEVVYVAVDGGPEGVDADGGGQGHILCSLFEGPVGSCDGGTDAGPVQRCTHTAPNCLPPADLLPPESHQGWACCSPDYPQAGSTCGWAQFADIPCR
jgi:hypothetical protein